MAKSNARKQSSSSSKSDFPRPQVNQPSGKPNVAKWILEVMPDGTTKQFPNTPKALRNAALQGGHQIGVHAKKMLPPNVQAVLALAQAADQMMPPGQRVSDRLRTAATKVPGLPVFKGSISSGGSSPTTMNSSYGLSKAPNPKPVHLNSNIMPNAYSNDYMTPVLNACSPMHVNNVYLNIPTTAADPLYSYFINTIAFDIQTRAQSNVTFNIDITNTFTTPNILTAMNAAIRALQVYFFYTSILSYESDARNKNPAMIALRNLMTPQLISDLAVLGRRLEDTPVPPRIVEWVRYLNMNFLSGDSQGSAIIKFGYDFDCLYNVGSTTNAANVLTNLVAGNNNAVFALIRRAIPKWRIGTLYDVPVTPVFDKNFVTIFANSPQQYGDSNTTPVYRRTPSVTTNTDNIAYNSYNNRLDGAAFASIGVSSGANWYGLMYPVTNGLNQRSRTSYYNNGTTTGWFGSDIYSFLTASREETYQIQYPNTVNPLPVHLFGSDKLQGVSWSSIQQTQQNFLDFLFNVDSIPTVGKMSSFNNNGANKI